MEMIIPYLAAWVVTTVVLHFYNSWQLGSRSGIARYRSLLPDKLRAKLTDAELLGRLRAIHASAPGWLVDGIYALGLALGSFAGNSMSSGYDGAMGFFRFIGAFVVVGVPVLVLAEWVRRKVYAARLGT